jgi:4,5-dihydroxyphthalate decarboxylase
VAPPLKLTLGISTNPLTRGLIEERIRPEGVEATWVGAYNAGPASNLLLQGKLDAAEFSLSSLFMAADRGVRLTVLPIFLGRGFVQRGLWRRKDAGIDSPADYAGKRVAMHRYNNSYGIAARAMLSVDYDVDLRSIHWVTARAEPADEPSPAGVTIELIEGGHNDVLPKMLQEGAIDGALELYLFEEGPVVQRVFPDFRSQEAAYYRATGVFPVYHTLVLRPEAVDGNPWVYQSLIEAFRAARRMANEFMTEEEADEATWLESVLDEDPYAYKLGSSERKALDQLNQSMVREGLLRAPVDIDGLFAATG